MARHHGHRHHGHVDEPRRGGGYGMGGYGGYEQGSAPGSYDHLLGVTERYYGYGDEEYGQAREEDERYWYEEDLRRQSARAYVEPLEWKARARGPGKAPKSYTRSDERIREDICERLMHGPYDASDVELTVSSGEVTLTGTVRNRADKWGIEDVAEATLGVQDVHNRIRINQGPETSESTSLAGDTRKFHA